MPISSDALYMSRTPARTFNLIKPQLGRMQIRAANVPGPYLGFPYFRRMGARGRLDVNKDTPEL